MRRMGIPDDLYTDILTSGEAVRRALQRPPDLWWAELGQRVFHLGPERDRGVIEGLPLTKVDTTRRRQFRAEHRPGRPPQSHRPGRVRGRCCRTARDHQLPMICANPDLQVIRGGVRVLCAGALAVRYQELGGDVRSLGKPDPAIYQPVLQLLGLPVERVLAVGDALHTDIAGAAGVDIASLLGAGRHPRRGAGGPAGRLRSPRRRKRQRRHAGSRRSRRASFGDYVAAMGRTSALRRSTKRAQCDSSTGAVISAIKVRVTPPNTSSRAREWP